MSTPIDYTSQYGANTTLGYASQYGSQYGGAVPAGSYVQQSGVPTVNENVESGYQELCVRVPAQSVAQYIQGPPQVRTVVIPGGVVEKIVPEYIPGPVQTVQEVIPGPVTYRDEKVEIPGQVRERIERVEVPGPVYERIVKEFVPGPEVVKEVTVTVDGPIVEKIVKENVPGPVIKRPQRKEVAVPGPIRYVPKPVEVEREVIREVNVPVVVPIIAPVPLYVPGPAKAVLLKQTDRALLMENAQLERELAWLRTRVPASSSAIKFLTEVPVQQQYQPMAMPMQAGFGGYGYPAQPVTGAVPTQFQ
eukprot:GILI01006156.1.p2 GENE.GILI01006156.1~~GILI01006156.1.p2  ORF type:complete len:318 (-),score=108.81 GILI01006156.1:22-936(-)